MTGTDVLIQRLRDLKTEAKNRRDRGLRGYPRAVEILAGPLELGRKELPSSIPAELQGQLAAELADCCGLLGGVERRWALEGPAEDREAHLRASALAHDAGSALEDDERYGILSSYNRVSRLVFRLLLQPELVDRGEIRADVREQLAAAAAAISDQLAGLRRGDHWAMADLALIRVLLGQAGAVQAYARLRAASPFDYVYARVLADLRPLLDLPLSSARAVRDAAELVEIELESLRS